MGIVSKESVVLCYCYCYIEVKLNWIFLAQRILYYVFYIFRECHYLKKDKNINKVKNPYC